MLIGRGPIIRATSYHANAVLFDGTNDYLTRGADLTGSADGKLGTVSFWFKLNGGDGSPLEIYDNGSFEVLRRSNNTLAVVAPGGGTTLFLKTGSTYTSGGGWHHFMVSWDLANNLSHVYVDDVDDDDGSPTRVDANIDYTTSNHALGAETGAGRKLNAEIADFYGNWAEYIDLSVESNRRKFISAQGKPVFLGATGQLPTGSDPIAFFSGPTVDWHTNKGDGEGFIENGALTDASSSPSD